MRISVLAALVTLLQAPAFAAETARLTVDPDATVGRIDEKVYGHFLEHIYHSVNGGLWGDLVWNRSFEQNDAGSWNATDEGVTQQSLATNVRLTFGQADWTDYEMTLQARKLGGAEGFLILFRVVDDERFYWCNLGGWQNQYHQLEKGNAGNRWGAVGPRAEGRIDADRWYTIKVRCEGPAIRVWLDDKLLIDFTDESAPHLRGKLGVGTWATKAEFRNVQVTSLDGKTLLDGLPKSQADAPTIADHWRAVGQCKPFIERDNPLNSAFCQRLVCGAGGGGLQQDGYCAGKGETYQGSLWVRGEAPDGLIVRLTDGRQTLAVAQLPPPTADWQELPFELACSADADDASLQVVSRGAGRFCVDQISLMPKSWRDAGGFRPDLLKAVADLKAPIIRWPGGCFASAYRWKDGIGPQHTRGIYPREIWDDIDVNSYGTDEFIAMCRRVGAEPLIVVNIGTPNWNPAADADAFMQEVLDWIEYCNGPADSKWGAVRAANGHPEPYNVKYWEIDNETWHMGAGAYAAAVRRFAPAMRKADPTIKLAACGSGSFDANWNRTIIEQCAELVDYLSIHHYENPDRFADGPLNYERFFRTTAEMIAKSKNPDMKLYVSEWNAQSTDWRTGLYCGGLLNAFERCGDVLEIGGPALFLRHTSATGWDNAFINFDQRTWFPAPNYVVMRLWREHYAPHRIALTGDAGALNMVATRSEDGKTLYVKAVNPTHEAVPVSLAADGATGASMTVVAPGDLRARNTLDERNVVAPKAAPVEIDGNTVQFTLPPISCAVVEIKRDDQQTASSNEPWFLLTSHRDGKDGLHLAISPDGLKWQSINNDDSVLEPTVGEVFRDPSIARDENGVYHLVWTIAWTCGSHKGIGYASSKDLIQWSEQRIIPVMQNEPKTEMVWAPELFRDTEKQQWMIHWSSSVTGKFPETLDLFDGRTNPRIYYTVTNDFQTFAPSKLLFNPNCLAIDSHVYRAADDNYYVFFKGDRKETPKRGILMAKAPAPEGPYSLSPNMITPADEGWAEGPCAIRVGKTTRLYYAPPDAFGAFETADMEHWKDVRSEMATPGGYRHGTVIRISAEQARRLLNRFAHHHEPRPMAAALNAALE